MFFLQSLFIFFLVESENLIFNSIYILSENIENQKESPPFHAQSLLVVIKNPAVVFFQAMRAFHPISVAASLSGPVMPMTPALSVFSDVAMTIMANHVCLYFMPVYLRVSGGLFI